MNIIYIAPAIRKSFTTASNQGEVVSRLLRQEGHRVRTAPGRNDAAKRWREIEELLAEKKEPDEVVLVELFSSPSRIEMVEKTVALAKATSRKVIVYPSGGGIPDFFAAQPERARRLLKSADVAVASSRFIARSMHALGLDVPRIPHVINLDDYAYRHRAVARPRLLWMRTFESDIYNPEMAVRVMAELRPRWPELTLVMGGLHDGPNQTHELAEELGLLECIHIGDFFESEQKCQAMSNADIFLNTNRIDNLPVSVMEAQAMGMPVVCTDVGGLCEIVRHGLTGLLVPSDDVRAMAVAVERILRDQQLAAEMSAEAHEIAKGFDWSQVYPRWLRLFERVVAGERVTRA